MDESACRQHESPIQSHLFKLSAEGYTAHTLILNWIRADTFFLLFQKTPCGFRKRFRVCLFTAVLKAPTFFFLSFSLPAARLKINLTFFCGFTVEEQRTSG